MMKIRVMQKYRCEQEWMEESDVVGGCLDEKMKMRVDRRWIYLVLLHELG